jgi:hypothetical protein
VGPQEYPSGDPAGHTPKDFLSGGNNGEVECELTDFANCSCVFIQSENGSIEKRKVGLRILKTSRPNNTIIFKVMCSSLVVLTGLFKFTFGQKWFGFVFHYRPAFSCALCLLFLRHILVFRTWGGGFIADARIHLTFILLFVLCSVTFL